MGYKLYLNKDGGSDGKESTCQCRRLGFDPWVGKIPGEGNSNPFQYSCLENSMNRGAWWASPWDGKASNTIEQLTLSLSFHTIKDKHYKPYKGKSNNIAKKSTKSHLLRQCLKLVNHKIKL